MTPALAGDAAGGTPRRGGRRGGVGARVFAALCLVVLTGAATAWLVGSAVAPGLFHQHMLQAGETGAGHEQVMLHAEEAFRSANGLSLAMALAAALLVSAAVSWWLSRRLARSLRPLTAAAADVADGRYGVRVPGPRLGAEVDALADAFNRMAGELQRVEDTRRRLLDDLGHELRTPVATLAAYLEAFEDGVSEPDAETLAVLRAQTARLARLASDVSAVSRAEEGTGGLDLQRQDVAELLAGAVAAAGERYRAAGVDLRAETAPGLPPVRADVDRVGQVLANLLQNAVRHTAPGGRVVIVAAAHGARVRISVTDDGEGIAAEHLPHLFERFYRADASRDRDHGGSGIGLAIVKALVEAHGGRVSAASEGPGRGATFAVELPAA